MKKQQVFKTLLIISTVVILLVVGISLTLLWQSQRKTGDETQYDLAFGTMNSPINKSLNSNIEIDFKAPSSQIVTLNTVYKIDSENEFYPSEKLVLSLIETLQLRLEDSTENTFKYSSSENNKSLEYDSSLNLINIYLYDEVSIDLSDENKVKLAAQQKLEEIGLWPWSAKSEYTNSYKYYTVGGYNLYKVGNFSEASILSVTFSSLINNSKLITSQIDSGEIEVLIDLNTGVISKITYTYRPISTTETATYPIISLDSALTQIQYRNSELIIPFEGSNPNSLTVEKIEFAYRILYEDQQYLQPVYVFEGTDENSQKVTLIVAAVEGQYLTNNK